MDAPEVVELKRKSIDTVSDLSFDDNKPTEDEQLSLRKVPDSLPWSASLIAIVELCERFAYYGLSGPFQNYLANKYHDPSGLPGAMYVFFKGQDGPADVVAVGSVSTAQLSSAASSNSGATSLPSLEP